MTSVGIDVSKGKSTVCILRPYGEEVASPYEIQHTEPEIRALVSHIRSMKGEVRIIMEATGAYHLPLLSSFKEAELFVSVINPLAMNSMHRLPFARGKPIKWMLCELQTTELITGLNWWITQCRMRYTLNLGFWGGNMRTISRSALKASLL